VGLVDWRLHDLRRTVSTVMHGDLAVPPHIVEAVLNHSGGHRAGVAGVYNRASYASKKFCACALGRLFGGRCRCDLIITDARLGTQKPGMSRESVRAAYTPCRKARNKRGYGDEPAQITSH
jgi:hypothetical protein